jgi:hypothetical protein
VWPKAIGLICWAVVARFAHCFKFLDDKFVETGELLTFDALSNAWVRSIRVTVGKFHLRDALEISWNEKLDLHFGQDCRKLHSRWLLKLQYGQQSRVSIEPSGQFFNFGQLFLYDATRISFPVSMHSLTVQLSPLFHIAPGSNFFSSAVQKVAKHLPQHSFDNVL